jgi:hypothetical protein
MPTRNTISIEMDVADAQEILYSSETMVKKLSWLIENQPGRNPTMLQARRTILVKVVATFKIALHQRARDNSKVVQLKGKIK